MAPLYPLRFVPIWRHYLWGGRRLASLLGKAIPPETPCAESWELVDRGPDQSHIAAGPLAGVTIGELLRDRAQELMGRHGHLASFPLLLKFLDARQPLSLQVHPDDAQAALLSPPDLGKTEAWVIVAAEPGSYLYVGLRPGVDRESLARAIASGRCQECVERLEPLAGDCIFIPAGVVHALGPGLVVAEIQQSSDTTYRLFDWNRVGPDGKPRELHVAAALDTIDFAAGPTRPARPSLLPEPPRAEPPNAESPRAKSVQSSAHPDASERFERLVTCDKFVLDRWRVASPRMVGGDDRAHLVVVLEGAVCIQGDAIREPLARGQTALVPASCGATRLTADGAATLLDIYLP